MDSLKDLSIFNSVNIVYAINVATKKHSLGNPVCNLISLECTAYFVRNKMFQRNTKDYNIRNKQMLLLPDLEQQKGEELRK